MSSPTAMLCPVSTDTSSQAFIVGLLCRCMLLLLRLARFRGVMGPVTWVTPSPVEVCTSMKPSTPCLRCRALARPAPDTSSNPAVTLMSSDSRALYLSVCVKKTHYVCWNGHQCQVHLNNSIANHNSLCDEATNALLLQPAVRMSAASPTICLTSSFFTLSCTHQGSMSCNLPSRCIAAVLTAIAWE